MWSNLGGARWRGALLALIGIASIIWLAANDKLGWYIHPRYFAFTVTLTVIAAVALIAALWLLPGGGRHGGERREHEHEHDEHEHATQPGDEHPRARVPRLLGTGALIVACAVGLLVLPPATLTTVTADQRDTGTAASPGGEFSLEGSEHFTVREWSLLLRQSTDTALIGQNATVLGFVTSDPDDDDAFGVARFVVNCCAVDAQPVSVPVYLPDWQDEYAEGDWVEGTGPFMAQPTPASRWAFVLRPLSVTAATAPKDPYVY